MTLDQFYAELRKVTEGGVKWEFWADGQIRAPGIPVVCPCPWRVVAFKRGIPLMKAQFPDCWDVAHAADNTSVLIPAIRAKLLECCGLEEVA